MSAPPTKRKFRGLNRIRADKAINILTNLQGMFIRQPTYSILNTDGVAAANTVISQCIDALNARVPR